MRRLMAALMVSSSVCILLSAMGSIYPLKNNEQITSERLKRGMSSKELVFIAYFSDLPLSRQKNVREKIWQNQLDT
jgi:hypothetical protein